MTGTVASTTTCRTPAGSRASWGRGGTGCGLIHSLVKTHDGQLHHVPQARGQPGQLGEGETGGVG